MGDRNATDYAELGHLGILKAGGALEEERLLRYREPVPSGDFLQGVYIDDHALFQKVKKKECVIDERAEGGTQIRHTSDTGEEGLLDRAVFARSMASYKAAGAEPKMSKLRDRVARGRQRIRFDHRPPCRHASPGRTRSLDRLPGRQQARHSPWDRSRRTAQGRPRVDAPHPARVRAARR